MHWQYFGYCIRKWSDLSFPNPTLLAPPIPIICATTCLILSAETSRRSSEDSKNHPAQGIRHRATSEPTFPMVINISKGSSCSLWLIVYIRMTDRSFHFVCYADRDIGRGTTGFGCHLTGVSVFGSSFFSTTLQNSFARSVPHISHAFKTKS